MPRASDATQPILPIRSPSRRPAEYCESRTYGSPYTIPQHAGVRPADVARTCRPGLAVGLDQMLGREAAVRWIDRACCVSLDPLLDMIGIGQGARSERSVAYEDNMGYPARAS